MLLFWKKKLLIYQVDSENNFLHIKNEGKESDSRTRGNTD